MNAEKNKLRRKLVKKNDLLDYDKQNEKNQKNKLPTLFLVFRIIGFLLFTIGAVVLVLGLFQSVPEMGQNGWFDAESRRSGMIFGGLTCLMFGLGFTLASFTPALNRVGIKMTKYIAEQNKEDLEDLGATMGGINVRTQSKVYEENQENIDDLAKKYGKTFANASKSYQENGGVGLLSENTAPKIFCKHCGKKIDADSHFCQHCGKNLN